MSLCPKCGKISNVKERSREYFLENRRGKIDTELCEICN